MFIIKLLFYVFIEKILIIDIIIINLLYILYYKFKFVIYWDSRKILLEFIIFKWLTIFHHYNLQIIDDLVNISKNIQITLQLEKYFYFII